LTFSFAERPQKVVKRTFEFEKLVNRRGIFIFEFIGNGISSRAIIKKGFLTLTHRATVNGMFLYILDENQNILKSQRTGVWIQSQFYKCEESGTIIIPYRNEPYEGPVILVHENFAEIFDLQIPQELYILGFYLSMNLREVGCIRQFCHLS
jgi:hypothetical protein